MTAIPSNLNALPLQPGGPGNQVKPSDATGASAARAFEKAFNTSLRDQGAEAMGAPAPVEGSRPSLAAGFVQEVDARGKVADAMKTDLLTGRSDNIHQTMVALQEAGLAFSLMVEVRNKLLETYQELMRMQV